ncbi:MAG: hypothetical protein M3Y27_26135 [Acidobacteriota bacterium]|nr:hypothetical protein [Acidobacteriota bacterium]
MPSVELNKSIEAKRVNKRSKLLFAEPPVTIPFGALIEDIEEDGENDRFTYLGELYQCTHNLLGSAVGRPESRSSPSSVQRSTVPGDVRMHWEELSSDPHRTWRAKVPGGWLIAVGAADNKGVAFYPDPDHAWPGRTID